MKNIGLTRNEAKTVNIIQVFNLLFFIMVFVFVDWKIGTAFVVFDLIASVQMLFIIKIIKAPINQRLNTIQSNLNELQYGVQDNNEEIQF